MTHHSIDVHNIYFNYSNTSIFNNFSISFPEKQWTSILGPSGVGKSTLLKIISGLSKGSASKDISNFKNKLSYLSQTDTLMPWLTALENVLISHTLQGIKNKFLLDKANQLFADFFLSSARDKYPHELSGGMRQRVRLIRTLLEDKSIILMDEPFTSLDVITRSELQNLAANYFKNKTVIAVTHDPLEALRLAQQIIVLGGTPTEIQTTIHLNSPTPRAFNHPEIIKWQGNLFNHLTVAQRELA